MKLDWVRGAVLSMVLVAPAAAWATCTATRCCNGGSCATPGCGPVSGIPSNITQAQCDQAQNDFLFACEKLRTSCTAGPCQCGSTSTPKPPGTTTPGTGAPASIPASFGAPMLYGPEQGDPFLSRNEYLDMEGRRLTQWARAQAARTSPGAAGAKSAASSRAVGNRFDAAHRSIRRTPGCFSVAQSAKFSYFRTLPTLTSPAEQSTFPPFDPLAPLPMIGSDQSNAQPLGGVGAHQGPPDTPPPPSPQAVNRANECNKGWYFNPSARVCYFSKASCDTQGSGCWVPNQDPTLGPGGHVNKPENCATGWYYNPAKRSCYADKGSCDAQLPSGGGETCRVPTP